MSALAFTQDVTHITSYALTGKKSTKAGKNYSVCTDLELFLTLDF